MSIVISSLLLGLRQVFDPAVLRILLKSIAVTLVIFAILAVAGWAGIAWLLARLGWADTLFAGADGLRIAASALLAAAMLWLLWRIVALGVVQYFADDVVGAVELAHYPEAARAARQLSHAEQMRAALGAGIRALLVNLAVLPLAALLIVTGIGPALLFVAVNAVLIGRELQDMVWLRHRHRAGAAAPVTRQERWLLGAATAGLLLVPFLHFLSPMIGAASAVHLVHRARAGGLAARGTAA